jgi:glycosyltransferase involved in cell wall biosynthesis
MNERKSAVNLSVIIPVGERHSPPEELYAEYTAGIAATGLTYEIIFVLDGPNDAFASSLERMLAAGARFKVVGLTRQFGEATAIMAGFEHAKADIIVTLPAYQQIEGSEIPKLVQALDSADLAIGRRWPRAGSPFESARRWMFHRLLGWVTGLRFHDLGCNARALKRQVLEEINLYGDQHRFLAVLADRQGFRVREVALRQSPKDQFRGMYRPREYTRSALDIFTVFFLVRFTKRPLRFFGMAGVTTFGAGGLWLLVIVVQRLWFSQSLAERPALLLASLLVVLGMQLFALGLLGELMIFTHARQLKDYQIADIVQFPQAAPEPVRASQPRGAATV